MHVRPEFHTFIGSGYWGKQKDFHQPSMEEVQRNSFQLPVPEGLEYALSRTHLDLLNIGHNVAGFNELDPDIRTAAEEIADRRGQYGEVQALGEQGKLAAIHMSNVADAQRNLIGAMMGPMGPALVHFMEALSEKVPAAEGQLVSLQVSQRSTDCMMGDVYAVTPYEYMGGTLKGISGPPLARISVDLTDGTAYMTPDDVFQGRT